MAEYKDMIFIVKRCYMSPDECKASSPHTLLGEYPLGEFSSSALAYKRINDDIRDYRGNDDNTFAWAILEVTLDTSEVKINAIYDVRLHCIYH